MISDGVISGLALRAVRRHVGLTQAALAESVGTSLDTVRGWETGRRSMARVAAGTATELRLDLQMHGADRAHLDVLHDAAHADALLARILQPGERHVLAHEVMTSAACDLIRWPLTGEEPRAIGGAVARPMLGAEQRRTVHAALREAAERARGDRAPQVRRQAAYLLAHEPESRMYLTDLASNELRRLPNLSRWSPGWVAARSMAVARAVAGNPEPLRWFLDRGLASDVTVAANLAYYAQWFGEDPRPQRSDEFMATGPSGEWRGDRLTQSLVESLVPDAPHVELTIRTLWSLASWRPWLLSEPTAVAGVSERAGRVLDAGGVRPGARRELAEIVAVAQGRGSG